MKPSAPGLGVVAVLATLFLLCSAGVAVAVPNSSGPAGDAAQAVYPNNQPPPPTVVPPPTESETPPPDDEDSGGGSGVRGDEESGGGGDRDPDVKPAAQVQPTDTTEGDDALPFTGFATIPVLLLGAFLLLVGVRVRRRSALP